MIEERKIPRPKAQNITLENREKMNVTGVIDVQSFNDECVVIETDLGLLIVRGVDLHISKLNLESGELFIEGDINSCEYDDKHAGSSGGGFFSKMFR
jgi:sporulation protein YabP